MKKWIPLRAVFSKFSDKTTNIAINQSRSVRAQCQKVTVDLVKTESRDYVVMADHYAGHFENDILV